VATPDLLATLAALGRDEQIARYREFFAHPDCNIFTDETAEEIIAAAQMQAAARRRGPARGRALNTSTEASDDQK
jgi:hypothetical protein